MSRVYNFSAGPSMMPEAVLKKAAAEMLDYQGSGQSVMEMSHRSKVFQSILDETIALVKEVLNVPDNYKILFLQGGGSTQFSMVPLNLMNKNNKADYIVTGNWANIAYQEACRYGKVRLLATSEDKNYSYIPKIKPEDIDPEADYVYYCMNNTIYGTMFKYIPETGSVPLVSDISSCICSEPIDISKFGLVYAGVQKNMGPAGATLVIVREDLLGNAMDFTPLMFDYKLHADKGTMYNTPPCYAIYVCKLMLEWIKNDIGGLEKMKERNEKKAAVLYDFLDSSSLFKGTVVKEDRSLMNIPFVTGDKELDALFVKEAEERGFVNLKGHRSTGGMRVSTYNAMPIEGVEKLVAFMKEFEEAHS